MALECPEVDLNEFPTNYATFPDKLNIQRSLSSQLVACTTVSVTCSIFAIQFLSVYTTLLRAMFHYMTAFDDGFEQIISNKQIH